MTHRPRTTSHDANHYIPRDFLRDRCGGFETVPADIRGRTMAYTANFRGHRITITDTSSYGGILTDWLVECSNGQAARVEIKTEKAYNLPEHDMTPGEQWIQKYGGMDFVFVCDDEDFYNLLCELVEIE